MDGSPHLVSDVMTRPAAAVGRDAPFKDIVALLHQWRVSALPVLEGEGRVIGVVSEADLLPKEEFRSSDPDRRTQEHRLADLAKAGGLTAADVMTAPAVGVRPDSTLAQAARIMARHGVKRLPVVDAEGLLVGIVSRADLLSVFLRGDDDLAEEVRDIVARLFPAPSGPVEVEVSDGVVSLTGRPRDTALVPVAARLVRAVEGVVDVEWNPPDAGQPPGWRGGPGPGSVEAGERPKLGEVTMQSSESVPRIVVGVDGSSSSYAALRWADRYARTIGGAVEAVHVWDTPSFTGWSGPAIDPDFDMQQARERFAEEMHTVFPEGRPPNLREVLVEGDPSEALIDASEGAEILVVGRRGRGAFTRAVLGSVSQRCAQHAACPVVVVRQEEAPAH